MKQVNVLSVGDLILDVPKVETFFEFAKEKFASADLLVGHIEVPHTRRGQWSNPEPNSAPAADPDNLQVLQTNSFDVITLGGNHIFDQGAFGVKDTLDTLHNLDILTAGAGMCLEEAEQPAVTQRNGLRIAVLQYNTVGPDLARATPLKAGCASLKVLTFYDMDRCEPGGAPSRVYTVTDPGSLRHMKENISAAQKLADVVLCYFHMGRMNTYEVLQYQREIAYAAVDAGADMVACHHSHALLGIETYRGRPIYYGLGHFVAVSNCFDQGSPVEGQHRHNPFGSSQTRPYWHTDVEMPPVAIPNYVFNQESRYTMIARTVFDTTGAIRAGLIPCWIDDCARPVPCVRGDGRGDEFMIFLRHLCTAGEMVTEPIWNNEGSEIIIPLGGKDWKRED